MYDDSYVPGFEDSEAVSAHGEGGGGDVGVTRLLPWTLPQFRTLTNASVEGQGVQGLGGAPGKWGQGFSCPRLLGTSILDQGVYRVCARWG